MCPCCKTEGHKAQECPWNKDEIMAQVEEEMEVTYPTICTHCRALDHMIEDCPALREADSRRRKITCERCGNKGHDITACLDETELEKERELKEAIKKKAKELEDIDIKIKKLGKASEEAPNPQDKDTNTFPSTRRKTSEKGKGSKRIPRKGRDEPPEEPGQPRDTFPGGGPVVEEEVPLMMIQMDQMMVMMKGEMMRMKRKKMIGKMKKIQVKFLKNLNYQTSSMI